jgi:hypothetical protein
MNTEYFECRCFSDEHTLKFMIDDGKANNGFAEYEPEVFCGVFLEDRSFFKRLWDGIKYIFGYKCRYGHFGNWILRTEDVERLEKLFATYKEALKEYRAFNRNDR